MTTVQVVTGPVSGGGVSAQAIPDTTVAVAAGFSQVAGSMQTIAAGNLTPGVADATRDRIDAIVVNSSDTLSVLAGPLADGAAALPPDTTGYSVQGLVYIINQARGDYTGTITADMVSSVGSVAAWDTTGLLAYVQLPEPADTMAFTFLSAAQTGDPGAGNLGFDTTNLTTAATLYVNYQSPTWGTVSGTGGYSKLIDWLSGSGDGVGPGQRGTTAKSYYMRLWSRKQPNRFVLVKVTAITDHTTYATLSCSVINYVQNDLGGVGTAFPLSTDAADTILEFNGQVSTDAVSSVFGRTGAVVAVAGDYAGCLVGIRNLLNGTTSYTKTAGTTTAYVECQAGGGATQTASVNTNAAGGGGAGGYSASKITTVDAGAHTVAIGAGGAAGNHGGGDTSYTKTGTDGGTAPLAKGGSAGGAAAVSSAGGAGGASGSGTGDITADGGGGGVGFFSSSTVCAGGNGGASFFGSAAAGGKAGAVGAAGGLYGGGASGGASVGSSSAAGGNGLLRITEYT